MPSWRDYITFLPNKKVYVKKKKFFEDNKSQYKFVESNSEKGMNYMKKYKANGVPLLVYNKNGKEEHKIGYNENFD